MAYYVIGEGNNLFESMTKEEILTAIAQAIATGTISDVDTGFVTKIKEQNKNNPFLIWVGTEAEYNAIQNKQANCLYIKTDDSTLETIAEQIAEIENINAYLSRQNKVLWEGAVNDSSSSAEKTLTAAGIGNYNLVALVVETVSGVPTGANQTATILAYRSSYTSNNTEKIRFAGNIRQTILDVDLHAGINLINDNTCEFSYAMRETLNNFEYTNIYLKKIIGVM